LIWLARDFISENIFHQSFHHWRIAIAVQSPKYATPALDKGLEILELLARSSRGLTLNEMSKAMGRTVSEIFRMVFTLEQRGYIASDDNDCYSLSLKMFELSHRQQPLKSLVVTAMPLMRELAGRACQSCHLVVYHDGRTIVVSQVDSPGPFTFGPKVGTLSRLTDTASGTILLAFVDEAERTRMIAAQIRIDGELEIDAALLLRQIEAVRSDTGVTWPSRRNHGVTDISRPVFAANREVLAALTVPYVERLDRLQSPSLVAVQEQVREVTLRLSELMSFSGHNTLQ